MRSRRTGRHLEDATPLPTSSRREVAAGFRKWRVVIPPGIARPYDEDEWRDALVTVERGAVEIYCRAGGMRRFVAGSVLHLTGMPLAALHNPGDEPVVLVAVARDA